MHRPPSFRRRSSYAPQLCAAAAFLLLLLLSLSILHIRLSSSPHLLPLPFLSSSNQSSNPNPNPISNCSSSDDECNAITYDENTANLDLLDEDQNPPTPPAAAAAAQTLFWDHALGVSRISFDRRPLPTPAPPHDFTPPNLAFGSDDEPVDEAVRAKLASVRRIEDVLLVGDSPMRDGWAKWLEGKGDFIRRDRMLRSNYQEMLNPRNHLLLQDPDVAGFAGLTRGDRMMRRAVLEEMDAADSGGLGTKGRRALREKLGFSEFVDRFFDGGQCLLRVFMVWNSPSWSFGVRHRRGVESLLYHHRNACVVLFSETVEVDFFKEFVKDG